MRALTHDKSAGGRSQTGLDTLHPLWARPGVLAACCTLLIIYGSLLPFDLSLPDSSRDWLDVLAAPQWVDPVGPVSSLGMSASASDVLINLLLYVPLGILLRLSLPLRGGAGWLSAALTVACLFVLSWSLESLQSLTAQRVSSRNDVLANVVAGGIAACCAPWLLRRFGRLVFRAYCATAGVRYAAAGCLRTCRGRGWPTYLLVGFNAIVVAMWYVHQVDDYVTQQGGSLPFAEAFRLPYDVAAVTLGRSMLVYVGLATLVLLALASRAREVRLGWVVVAVVGLSVAAEAHRAATHNARPDITGPILAATAATLLTLTLYCFSLAVQRANRRKSQNDYQGKDRRRMQYHYTSPTNQR